MVQFASRILKFFWQSRQPCATLKILEPDARAGEKAREGRKEERIAGRLPFALGDQRLGERVLAEQRRAQLLVAGAQHVAQLLVLRQLAEQREQQSGVVTASRPDGHAVAWPRHALAPSFAARSGRSG